MVANDVERLVLLAFVEKVLVDVLLVITALVALKLPVESDVEVALPRVEVLEVKVAIVAFVAVKFVKNAVVAEKSVAKKLVEVPLPRVKNEEKRLVLLALVAK